VSNTKPTINQKESTSEQEILPIINCHTHIFTLDHVPNYFGKKLIPFGSRIFSIKRVKWYMNNFTKYGSKATKAKLFAKEKRNKKIKKWSRKLWVPHKIYVILRFFWLLFYRVLFNFLTLDFIYSKDAKAIVQRFRGMARYGNYANQEEVYKRMATNYQEDVKFVVLPMDMEYMEAGYPAENYLIQLERLFLIQKKRGKKGRLLSFIFVDPRRIRNEKNESPLPKKEIIDSYGIDQISLQLGRDHYADYIINCFDQKKVFGLKLYPALGYYPFDQDLIPTYQYALKNNIPIITHCIAGTVYYRGKKKKEWNRHPILQSKNNQSNALEHLLLDQDENKHFSKQFTHPLNYECLLNPELLSKFMGEELDFSTLKICLAHFGGTSEWHKYLNDPWSLYNNNINNEKNHKKTLTDGRKTQVWWNANWLSIIYDLILAYPNVYTDVSYIIHDENLYPLLKDILRHPKIRTRVLFGTDYYVVAQKKTDKEIVHRMRAYLGEELFHQLAVINPREFLQSKIHPKI